MQFDKKKIFIFKAEPGAVIEREAEGLTKALTRLARAIFRILRQQAEAASRRWWLSQILIANIV